MLKLTLLPVWPLILGMVGTSAGSASGVGSDSAGAGRNWGVGIGALSSVSRQMSGGPSAEGLVCAPAYSSSLAPGSSPLSVAELSVQVSWLELSEVRTQKPIASVPGDPMAGPWAGIFAAIPAGVPAYTDHEYPIDPGAGFVVPTGATSCLFVLAAVAASTRRRRLP